MTDRAEAQRYRDAMARLGAAVSIVTTLHEGRRHGFTASAVCSVSDSPPTLLLCMNRGARQHESFRQAGFLCVNVLAAAQQEISRAFAGPETGLERRFDHGCWTSLATGAPVLEECLASFDCLIGEARDVGSHSVFFCPVREVRLGGAEEGLMYFDRRYHRVG